MRTRRVLFRAIVAASLVLSLLAAAVWVRSYYVADLVQHSTGELESPPAAAPTKEDPFAADWRHHQHTLLARHDYGLLYLTRRHYTSYREKREELGDWDRQRGWDYMAFPPGKPPFSQPAHFNTIADWSALGMSVQPFNKGGEEGYVVALPYALVLLLVGWPAAWWGLHSWRVHRRRRAGLCLKCGYDLHGARGPCPECGNIPVLPRQTPTA